MLTLTATVMTHNSMATLEACLRSLWFADEVLVVDDRSSDGTKAFLAAVQRADLLPELMGKLRWFERKLDSFPGQRRALAHRARGRWLLVVDADEEVSPALAQEILETIAVDEEHGAFMVPMDNRLPAHWPGEIGFSNHQRRLVRAATTAWPDTTSVHAGAEIVGEVGRLHHPIVHHSYDSLRHLLRKQLSYGLNGGQQLLARGRRASAGALLLHTVTPFLRYYFAKGLWRHGLGGLIVAIAHAGQGFVKYAALWEAQWGDPPRERMAVPAEGSRTGRT